MATYPNPVDCEGILRGRCVQGGCNCFVFSRRANSVNCNCGHAGRMHAEVRLCRGSVTNGGECECKAYKSSPFGECIQCGHSDTHHLNTPAVGGIGDVPSTTREAVRSIANEQRRNDYERRVVARDERNTRGGYRVGAGRKPGFRLDNDKVYTVAPAKMDYNKKSLGRLAMYETVKVLMPVSVSSLKAACAEKFRSLLDLAPNTSSESRLVDRIYCTLQGPEILDGQNGPSQKIPSRCYYYHTAFDNLSPAIFKRHSTPDGCNSDTEDNVCEADFDKTKRGRIDDEAALGCTEETTNLHSALDDTIAYTTKDNATVDNSEGTSSDTAVALDAGSRLANAYVVSPRLIIHLRKCYGGDDRAVEEWLNRVLCGGPNILASLLEFFNYYAFNIYPSSDFYNDDTVRIRLDRFSDNEDVGEEFRHQIRCQWKSKMNEFDKVADVTFKNEPGVGAGPADSYLEIIRTHFIRYVLEGSDDHRLVSNAADLSMQDDVFLFVGKLMGHVARHGKYIIDGLSDSMRTILRRGITDGIFAALEDVPSYESQKLIQKTIENFDALTVLERNEFDRLVDMCGLSASKSVQFDKDSGHYNVPKQNVHYVVSAIVNQIVIESRARQIMQLARGFNEVAKFTSFMELCVRGFGTSREKSFAEPLLAFFFPTTAECTISKDQLLAMLQVVETDGFGAEANLLRQCLKEAVEQLNENDRAADLSVAHFLQLCTACRNVPLSTKITWRLFTDDLDSNCFFHVCQKSVDVSVKWFSSTENAKKFVVFLCGSIRCAFEGYAQC